MKKQYTREQIVEAIRYWESVLKRIDEAQTAILNALEKVFGKTIYEDRPFIPTSIVMNAVFDILNKTLFNSQLPKIGILCLTTEQIQAIFNKYRHNRDASKLHAVYFPLPDFTKINAVKKSQVPEVHYLMINISGKDNPMNFSFAINSLCHEMIHYLDTIKGDLLFKWKTAFDSNKQNEFNEHETKMFMKKENQFNKEGLTIIPNDGGYSQKELNDLSSFRMKKLQEMEDCLLGSRESRSHIVATDLGDGRFAISF